VTEPSGGPDALAPDGSEIRYVQLGGRSASLVEVTLVAGLISRPVRHRTVEEIWYFLAGAGRVWLRDPHGREQVHEVASGASLVIPQGWAFHFAAGPGGPLRFLCYTSPPWPGDAEAEPVPEGGLGPATA
jgi:mannose-6-phosphate isomerase-like protein (cupin superfamily)